MTVEEVAKMTGISSRTIYRWLADGRLPGRKENGIWDVEPSDLLNLLRNGRDTMYLAQAELSRKEALAEEAMKELRQVEEAIRDTCRTLLSCAEDHPDKRLVIKFLKVAIDQWNGLNAIVQRAEKEKRKAVEAWGDWKAQWRAIIERDTSSESVAGDEAVQTLQACEASGEAVNHNKSR